MHIVLTIVGKDKVGIIARVSALLAENNINILSINQTILEGYFTMVMLADMEQAKVNLRDLQQILQKEGEAIGVEIKAQHEDIFHAMHRI